MIVAVVFLSLVSRVFTFSTSPMQECHLNSKIPRSYHKISMSIKPENSFSRRAFATLVIGFTPAANAFDIFETSKQIGWGDAKDPGVKWDGGFANILSQQPLQFSTEVVNGNGNPVFLSFVRPKDWKISTNTGIAIQDYLNADSAYVLVCPAGAPDAASLEPSYLLSKVFDINGRYGAFGKIDDVRVTLSKTSQEGSATYRYVDFKFRSLSPGGRDIERVGCLKAAWVDGDAIMLIASARSGRWKSVGATVAETLSSFVAVPAPQTAFKRVGGAPVVGNKDASEAYKLLRFDSPVWRN